LNLFIHQAKKFVFQFNIECEVNYAVFVSKGTPTLKCKGTLTQTLLDQHKLLFSSK